MATTCIATNLDITGIGVRTAIYAQTFFSFLPAIRVLWDGKITPNENNTMENQSSTILITAFTLLFSTIIQATSHSGLSNFDTGIVLNLSWMNNTNVFIYILLYTYRRIQFWKKVEEKVKEREEMKKEQKLWNNAGKGKEREREAIEDEKERGGKNTREERETFRESSNKGIKEDTEIGQDMENATTGLNPQSNQRKKWVAEVNRLLHHSVFWIGSLHLSLMGGIGIWLWSKPTTFGGSQSCPPFASMPFFGGTVPFSSKGLQVWSMLVYSILLIPGINMIPPMLIILSPFYFFTTTNMAIPRSASFWKHCTLCWKVAKPILLGFFILFIVDIFFLVNTEIALIKLGDDTVIWSFGQTLALFLLLVPAKDFIRVWLESQEGERSKIPDYMNRLFSSENNADFTLLDDDPDDNIQEYYASEKAHGVLDAATWFFQPRYANRISNQIALLSSAYQKHFHIVNWVLNQDVGLEPKFMEALKSAANNKLGDVIGVLAKLGTGSTPTKHEYKRALLSAAKEKKEYIVKLLVEHTINKVDLLDYLNAKDEDGNTTLYYVAKYESLEMVEYLFEKCGDLNVKGDNGKTALYAAAEMEKMDLIKFLIIKGVDINAKSQFNQTPLHVAAERGHEAVVKFLVDKGADINTKSGDSKTALYAAAEEGHEAVVKFLVDKGADINAKSGDSKTALHAAAEEGHEAVVKFLVDKGADINAKSDNGRTAIHVAAEKGQMNIVKFLIEKSADINIKDQFEDIKTAVKVL